MRERRSKGLLALVRWAGRGSAGDTAVRHAGNPAARYGELDWQKAQEQLGPVRPRWDLAILSNLDPETGRRPKDILAAVNAQAETEHTLSPQVLSARLRYLEQDGYVRHEDSSAAPLRRVYYLLAARHAPDRQPARHRRSVGGPWRGCACGRPDDGPVNWGTRTRRRPGTLSCCRAGRRRWRLHTRAVSGGKIMV